MSKKLRLLLNIGTVDQAKLGLTETREGHTVDVSEDVAKELLKRGWAALPGGPDAPDASARPSTRQATEAPAGIQTPPESTSGGKSSGRQDR